MLLIGLDIGTEGARATAITEAGEAVALCREPLQGASIPDLPEGHAEQDPQRWWDAAAAVLKHTVEEVRAGAVPSVLNCC